MAHPTRASQSVLRQKFPPIERLPHQPVTKANILSRWGDLQGVDNSSVKGTLAEANPAHNRSLTANSIVDIIFKEIVENYAR